MLVSRVAILSAAISLRSLMSALVETLDFIPSVELVCLGSAPASRMMTLTQSRSSAGRRGLATHYLESLSSSEAGGSWQKALGGTPFHSTSPPKMDLEALPDPRRADSERLAQLSRSWRSLSRQSASAESPEADEASPEAVGKEFPEVIRNLEPSMGSVGFPSLLLCSTARCLARASIRATRGVRGVAWPFNMSSSWAMSVARMTVVVVFRSSELRVRLIESLRGRMESSSYLPQYFTRAMFGAVTNDAFRSFYMSK